MVIFEKRFETKDNSELKIKTRSFTCTQESVSMSSFQSKTVIYYRGGSRGRVQGVRTPPWDDLRPLSN